MGSTSSRMRIMVYETVLSVYNPDRGRVYMCVAGSGGGTRYARFPPVIEIIPRSGYLCLHGVECGCFYSCLFFIRVGLKR